MYTFTSRIRYSECDENARLGIVPLINYLQDCSTFNTESLGLGIEHMARNHFAWLLAAWQIEIDRLPRFCEEVEIGTWSYDMKPTYAMRNFIMRSPNGAPFVRADSIWFAFDTERNRPIRIPNSELAYLTDEPRLDMPPTQRKISVDGPGVMGTPIVVTEQHLDTNQHVNNAQYVLMALSSLDSEVTPKRICVQYKQQARLGDVLTPCVHAHEDAWTVELLDKLNEPYAIIYLETSHTAATNGDRP